MPSNKCFKAFDTVNHYVLFKKLLMRGIPIPIASFLLHWYCSQLVCVHWNGTDSAKFSVSNGVCQGGVLSPSLFTVYVDSFLCAVHESGHGCYWHSKFAGALSYADDLTILVPPADGLLKCWEYVRNLLAHTMFVSIQPKLS